MLQNWLFNWVNSITLESASQFIKETTFETAIESLVNPLATFIKENFILDVRKTLYVGFMKATTIEHEDVQQALNSNQIYPVYSDFCQLNGKKPIGDSFHKHLKKQHATFLNV